MNATARLALDQRSGTRDRTVATTGMRRRVASRGEPLPATLRAEYESRFGHDLSAVRIHTDRGAASSAAQMCAAAYTVGADVVFGRGMYRPATAAGRRLIAHELTHVVQQARGGALPGVDPRAAHEREAKRVERTYERSSAPLTIRHTTGTGVALNGLQPLELSELFAIIVRERAWTFSPGGGQLDVDPTGAGRGVGPAAGGRRAGFSVFAVIQVTDAGGNLVDLGYGEHLRYGDAHAEAGAMRALEQRVASRGGGLRGGTMTVVVDQLPCPPGRANCAGNLRAFAQRHSLSLDVYVPTRATARGPGQVSPRTAAMSSQRTDVPAVTLRRLEDLSFSGPGGVSGPRVVVARPSPRAPSGLARQRAQLGLELGRQTRRTVMLGTRLTRIIRGAGRVIEVLSMLSTVNDIMSIRTYGTTMPEVERQADAVIAESEGLRASAEEITGDISLLGAVMQVEDAIRRADQQALMDLSGSLGDLGFELESQGEKATDLARQLRARSDALAVLADAFRRLAHVPSGATTAGQASALAQWISLERLSNRLRNAADKYEEAGSQLSYHGQYLGGLGFQANRASWRLTFENISAGLAEYERLREEDLRRARAREGASASAQQSTRGGGSRRQLVDPQAERRRVVLRRIAEIEGEVLAPASISPEHLQRLQDERDRLLRELALLTNPPVVSR